jgi:hypothetical protein
MVQEEGFWRKLTVAHVRGSPGAEYVEVLFLESARFYRLHKSNARFNEIQALLDEAKTRQNQMLIRLGSKDADVIEEVKPEH